MIFVSYSWVCEKPDKNVLRLVANLRENGYDAICDIIQAQEVSSINFAEMMSKSLKEAEKVIIVLSEMYKNKADSFIGGVGEEYRFIISDIQRNEKKYIFVRFDNNFSDVVPDFLKGRDLY